MHEFFESIGFYTIDSAIWVIAAAVVLLLLLILYIVQIVKYTKLKKRFEIFMSGRDAASMESEIGRMFEDMRRLKEVSQGNRSDIRRLLRTTENCFQKVGLVKYDAFQQVGGKLSFALALLDEKNDGFIINSVHSTDACYEYAKSITAGISDVNLSTEEEKALSKALKEGELTV